MANKTVKMDVQHYDPDPDPKGDVILDIGSEHNHHLIRVSSRVLGLASPVLAALFGPNFSEGHSLSDDSSGFIPNVSLPNDDPEAMTWLCYALHFKKRVTEQVSFPLLKGIAILCDKYDMSRALGPWTVLWMQTWASPVEVGDVGGDYGQMLWVSYALDNQSAFWDVTRELILSYTAEDLLAAGENLTKGILPDCVLGE